MKIVIWLDQIFIDRGSYSFFYDILKHVTARLKSATTVGHFLLSTGGARAVQCSHSAEFVLSI